SGAQFYRVVVSLMLEGFLCDPVYGGNRGEVGWKLVGHVPQLPRPLKPYSSWRS
ncbi:MAG: gluconate 2-dehydrogenase subunit 3 family protein, partial [Myxococcales bacterium]|nr:gluconate 2-dehydrogenase subunit 3 family protein [Myxococcales bacterium]